MSPLARQGGLAAVARARLAAAGPMPSGPLAREVLGLARVDDAIAERLVGTLLGGDSEFERTGDGRWRLRPRSTAGAVRSIREIPFVVVDVETTGGRPPGDRVTEIGAVRVRAGRVEAEWSSLVNPGRPIPSFVSRLTGIRDATVAAAPPFAAVADSFLEFLGGAVFVAHNARFDWRFVNAELLRSSGGLLTNARLCTVRLARRLLPHVRRRNLDALAWLFGVEIPGRHRALPDARATARILFALLAVAEEQGIGDELELAALGGVGGTLWPARPY
ncbi:MAG TPA: exonuclease domain-containing protein [Gemmatimonadota bacterium]|jgi:DNA polymerase-3 subunit epsilon